MAQCNFVKDNGERCGQQSAGDDGFCIWHSNNPERKKEAHLIRVQGGINRRVEPIVGPYPGSIANVKDLLTVLNSTLLEAWQLQGERKIKGVCQVLRLFVDVLPLADTDERLAALENLIYGKEIQKPKN